MAAAEFVRERGFILPPFAFWTPEEWKTKGQECAEIVRHGLGWDITDWGWGNFREAGLFLFTIRNGHPANLGAGRGKLYAEKIMMVEPGQVTPRHFHWSKTEDIINRGGGNLAIELHLSEADGALSDQSFSVLLDGVERQCRAGEIIELSEGESITLPTGLYHKFWGIGERTLVGEVSNVNDDANDNRFYENVGRFPVVEEDEPPQYLLVSDYAKYYRGCV